ncbi:unnamed protein product [Psylliodes chrysocephalus]|uniref:ferroxidase n=1 Tax=Psylliodes chrysocephalus TaxID=3402493 RepID=A0A9P0GMG1_9CUCU|nr:unnamed protein product [Psylliodes chrysocephala]
MLRVLRRFRHKNIPVKSASSHNAIRDKRNIFTKISDVGKISTIVEKCQPFSQKPDTIFKEVDPTTFEKVCEETLESLSDFFEELLESNEKLRKGDVSFSSGVLTVNLGKHGTYVMNRQTPNKQIWLSSPKSGPKRYDFVPDGGYWIYKHDFKTLHELLENELTSILGLELDMSKCSYYKKSGH